MKPNRLPLACLLFALAAPFVARAELKLPQSQDDFRELTQSEAKGQCAQCGVVTDVRSASRQSDERPSPTAQTPDSGIGDDIATTPIVGRAAKEARQARQPATFYKLTVRYDNGTYAFFEQDEQPAVNKGDTVEVIDGRVVARTAP